MIRYDESEDPVVYVRDMLADMNGLSMSYETIDLIIRYFWDFKFNLLMNGYQLRETGLYEVKPRIRIIGGVPKLDLLAKFEPELLEAFARRIVESDEVRERSTGRRNHLKPEDVVHVREIFVDKVG